MPAGLEFLGCGGIDNSAPGEVEYVGAPRLTVVPSAGPDCVTPSTVATVTNPAGRPAGVYTQVTWALGNLSGFAGPYMMGYLRDLTGNFSAGLFYVTALLVVSIVLVLIVSRLRTVAT